MQKSQTLRGFVAQRPRERESSRHDEREEHEGE